MKSAAPSIILRSAATSGAAISTRFPTLPMMQPTTRTTGKATSAREQTVQALKREGKTLGAWLAARGPHERKRGEHATRDIVGDEFDTVWMPLVPEPFRSSVRDAIFVQRPVFWRLNTLGRCRFVPDARLCPKGSWLSQQRRMLEKLNNLALAGGNQRPLDPEERQAILSRLQTQASMTWPGVRRALAPLYRARARTRRGESAQVQPGGRRREETARQSGRGEARGYLRRRLARASAQAGNPGFAPAAS